MPFLIYSILAFTIFKIVIDAIGFGLLAPYSVLLETLIFGFILAILIRTSVLQKEGRRENLEDELAKLREKMDRC